MDHCKDFIRAEFPAIDIEMFQYIEGKIISSGTYSLIVYLCNLSQTFKCSLRAKSLNAYDTITIMVLYMYIFVCVSWF